MEDKWPSKLKKSKQLWFVQSVDAKSCRALLTRKSWCIKEGGKVISFSQKARIVDLYHEINAYEPKPPLPCLTFLAFSPLWWGRCWIRPQGNAEKGLLSGWEFSLFSPVGYDSSTHSETENLGGGGKIGEVIIYIYIKYA